MWTRIPAAVARCRDAVLAPFRRCPHENAIATEFEWTAYAHAGLCLDCGHKEYALSPDAASVLGPEGIAPRPRRLLVKPRQVTNIAFNEASEAVRHRTGSAGRNSSAGRLA